MYGVIQLSAATEIALFSCCKKRPELHKNFTAIKNVFAPSAMQRCKSIICVQCGFEGAGALEKMGSGAQRVAKVTGFHLLQLSSLSPQERTHKHLLQ